MAPAKLARRLQFPRIRNRQATRVPDNDPATPTLYIKETLSSPQG